MVQKATAEAGQAAVDSVAVPVIGCGAGPACHGHVLVLQDWLGMTDWQPSFATPAVEGGAWLADAASQWTQAVERGEYLARHVLACVHCHTRRDQKQLHAPATGPEFAGGDCLDEEVNFPGSVCAPNITPDVGSGIGTWSDDEILRAVREGVSRDGRALFPLMPYGSYRTLADEDAHAVVAFLRTLAPVENSLPPTRLGFPVSFYVNRLPEPLEDSVSGPAEDDRPTYGEYLATVASCKGCHGENLAGGQEFPTRQGVVRAPNLTPHETGVVPAGLQDFERLFSDFANAPDDGSESTRFTVMPRAAFANMKSQDLAAIHSYLRSVPPVNNPVKVYGALED